MSKLDYKIDWRYKNRDSDSGDKFIKLYQKWSIDKSPFYVSDAMVIYNNSTLKLYLEAMLLGKCNDFECARYFECVADTIKFYRKFFFDISDLPQIKLLEIASSGSEEEASLKISALHFGKEFIMWHLGLAELSPEYYNKIKLRLKNGMLIKAMGHEFVSSDSKSMDNYLKIFKEINKLEKESNSTKVVDKVIEHFASIIDN